MVQLDQVIGRKVFRCAIAKKMVISQMFWMFWMLFFFGR